MILASVVLAAAQVAVAHSFEPARLDLQERGRGIFDVAWKLPGVESGWSADGDGGLTPDLPDECQRIEPSAAAHAAAPGLSSWRVDCGATALHGARLSIPGLEGSRVDVIVRITWRDGSTASGVLRSGLAELVVPASGGARALSAGASARAVLWSYGRLGVERSLGGVDHLLLVLGLLLLVTSWGALVKTLGAFAVAHSLALALAVLGIIQVPAATVDTFIALSLMMVALELARGRSSAPTLSRQYPWAVALVFGWLHGLGFAVALAAVGLPSEQVAVALLAFNVGVEIGLLAFVLAMAVPCVLWARVISTRAALRLVPAYAMGTLAMAWALQGILRFWET